MPGKTVQRLPLRIPQDPLHRQSGNQFLLSASILDRFSLGKLQSSDIQFQYPLLFSQNLPLMLPSNYRPNSHLSLSAMVHYWAYLGINPYNTPWPCSYTHISTFPRRSGALVLVTHIVRECTAFGNLQSLAQSRRFRMQEDGVDVFISVTLRITREVSRKRECSSSWEIW